MIKIQNSFMSFLSFTLFVLSLFKRGAKPAWIHAETVEKLKAGNPWGKVDGAWGIRKVTFASVWLGVDYQKAVRKDTGDATFEAGELPWGKWIKFAGKRSFVITHKGKFYLRVAYRFGNAKKADGSPLAKVCRTFYVFNGKVIPKTEVAAWKYERKPEETIVRNYTISNLRRVNVEGQKITLAS